MNYYQIYWTDGYEGDSGGILSHKNKFTQQEYDEMVQTAKHKIGGYMTFLQDIEEYMIENFGFKRVKFMRSQT
jgi:hypothetical protein